MNADAYIWHKDDSGSLLVSIKFYNPFFRFRGSPALTPQALKHQDLNLHPKTSPTNPRLEASSLNPQTKVPKACSKRPWSLQYSIPPYSRHAVDGGNLAPPLC